MQSGSRKIVASRVTANGELSPTRLAFRASEAAAKPGPAATKIALHAEAARLHEVAAAHHLVTGDLVGGAEIHRDMAAHHRQGVQTLTQEMKEFS